MSGSGMKWALYIANALVIIGGINWGLVGAFQFNLVDAIFGAGSPASRVVYVLVGIAAVIAIANYVVTPRRPISSTA